MRVGYTPLEEAHPPIKRPTDGQMGAAVIQAFRKAAMQGSLRAPVPDSLRPYLLAQKRRHPFFDKGSA